jgi:hypothetical protein
MEMTEKDIRFWLHSMGIYDYDICNGIVHVVGDVHLYGLGLTHMPVQFGYVSGGLNCGSNNLVSLEGCPSEVGGSFDCSTNQLTSLEGGPSEVGGNLFCDRNNLKTLKGAPIEVGGDFLCDRNWFVGEPDHSHIGVGGEFVWD